MEAAYHDAFNTGGGHDAENGYGSYNTNGRPRAQYGSINTSSVSLSATSQTTTAVNASNIDQSQIPVRRMSGSSMAFGADSKDAPVGFDEGILRGLCDMDGSLNLLSDRIKQSIASCKAVSHFFKSRAEVEEKYGRGLLELARSSNELYAKQDCKAGSFVTAYQSSLRLQEQLGQNRLRFAQRLGEMSEELQTLAREGEKQRKLHKDNGGRDQTILQESEQVMDKAKSRFDSTAEELERILVAKEGEQFRDAQMRGTTANISTGSSNAPSQNGGNKRGIGKAMKQGLFKPKNPAQMQRHEDDVRSRMSAASEAFRKAVLESQNLRQEYFKFQFPKIVRLLKDCADELDLGVQYHLTRYAFLYETAVVNEGQTLNASGANDDGGANSLRSVFETIDNRNDFKSYMQNYAVARNTPKGPRREGLYDEGYVPQLPHLQGQQNQSSMIQTPRLPGPQPQSQGQQQAQQAPSNGTVLVQATPPVAPHTASSDAYPQSISPTTGATFGVDLGEQLARDGAEVPKIVIKCAEAIEAHGGLDSMGIYRLSGTTSKVQSLKNALDKDIDNVNVMDEQWGGSDINIVSGALKLWFRELPEPLLTFGLYHGFIEAARYENDRLRHIRLHEQVNELPDPNYATLKYFMGHLDKVRRQEGVNQMSASNLSIVFGPTLLGAPPEEGGLNLEHMNYQCKAIETVLEKYQEIFVEEDDESEHYNATPAQASA